MTGPTTLPSPPPDEPTTVTLLSAGDEPRRVLRYRPRVGDRYRLRFAMQMGMAMSTGGYRMFGQDVESTGTFALEVTRIDSGGDISLAMTILEMTEPSYDPSHVGPLTESYVGLRGTFVITDRGLLVDAEHPLLESAEARDTLNVQDYLLALPAEPVGRGASWRVELSMIRNGITMQVIQTHDLITLDAAGGTTEMREAQHSTPQLVPGLGRDSLTTLEVVSFSGAGSGNCRFTLDRPLPAVAASQFDAETKMVIDNPAMTQDVAMTMTAKLRSTVE